MRVVMNETVEFGLDAEGEPGNAGKQQLTHLEKTIEKLGELKSCKVRITVKVEVLDP